MLNLRKTWIIYLCFLLSMLISGGVVLHAFYGVTTHFASHAFLAAVFVVVTEISFIALPYISSLQKKSRLDQLYIAMLFIISIMPAMMSSSSAYFDKQNENAVAAPVAPIYSTLSEKYTEQLKAIEISIQANNKQIALISEKTEDPKFVAWRTKTYRESNDSLIKKKDGYLIKIDKLDSEYEEAMKKYNLDLHNYQIKTKQNGINWFMDQMTLWYSLILVFILQLVNARFAYHGSTLLNKLKENSVENNIKWDTTEDYNTEDSSYLIGDWEIDDISKVENTDNIPTISDGSDISQESSTIFEGILHKKDEELSFRQLTPLQFLQKYAVADLDDKVLQRFLKLFQINDLSKLNKLINADKKEKYINQYFNKETANKLLQTLNIIKER